MRILGPVFNIRKNIMLLYLEMNFETSITPELGLITATAVLHVLHHTLFTERAT